MHVVVIGIEIEKCHMIKKDCIEVTDWFWRFFDAVFTLLFRDMFVIFLFIDFKQLLQFDFPRSRL